MNRMLNPPDEIQGRVGLHSLVFIACTSCLQGRPSPVARFIIQSWQGCHILIRHALSRAEIGNRKMRFVTSQDTAMSLLIGYSETFGLA